MIVRIYAKETILQYVKVFCNVKDNFSRNIFKKVSVIIEKQCCYASSKNKSWNVLFFGSDDFSLESLKKLHTEYKENKLVNCLEVVSTSTNKNNVISNYAKDHGLHVHKWPLCINPNKFHVGVVVSFGHLIPSHIINSFPLGMINVHASLLPRWRGAAPIIHTLKNGDTVTGISVMKIMPKKFDIGDIVMQKEVNIHPNETLPELYNKLAQKGGELLITTFTKLPEILDHALKQNNENVTYAPRVTKNISFVKWNEMTAKNIYDLQRALSGLYDLRTKFNNKIVKLLDIEIVTEWWNVKTPRQKIPGLAVYSKEHDSLLVSCSGNDWISVKKIILPGKSAISATNFNNGFMRNQKKDFVMFES